jgi:hypothetical protein
MQRVLLIAAAALLAACSAKSSTAPANGDIAGSWSGSITDGLLGSGTLSLTLAQSGDSVTGTWSTTFSDTTHDTGGLVAGNVSGSTLSIQLRPLSPSTCQYGPFDVTASVTGTSMSGTYSTVQCAAEDGGTLSATIQ